MKKNYVYPIQGISSILLWACLLISQITGAQSIPDAQWARVGSSLAITNDGNIVTSEISLYNSYPGYGVTLGVARLVKYSLQGDQIWSTFGLSGGNFIGDKLPPGLGLNYAAISRISASAASADGGVLATGPVNFDVTGGSRNVAVRVGADGTGGGWKEEDVAIGNTPSDLIATSDGGFLLLYSKWQSNAPSPVVLRRYDAGKQVVWTKEISYPGSSSPDIGLTRGSRIINTPDGGYLLVGYFNEAGLDSPSFAWVAKLDGNGNVSWQRLLTNLPHNSQPNDIYVMNSITDVIISADGSGYTLVGLGVGLPFNKASAIAEIDFNGNPKPGRGKTIGPQGPKNFISAYTGSGGKKLYAVGTTEGTAPKILLIDPAGLNVLATRTFQGPGASSLIGIATAGDGSLVFATDNKQLVKLQPEATTQPPVGALTLIAPTYNCQTGAITFNTSGGDGTLIEYMAPGITGWTTNPNHILDACARTCADTPPFVISARQSGKLVTYTWSRQAYCANPTDIVRVSPIADMTVTVGQSVYFPIGGHFSSALTTNWSVGTSGLPPGITYFFRQEGSGSFIPTWVLLGTPTTAGVYSVTAFASANGGSASTTFQFIVTNANTSNPLTLTAPTYNCTTGAFTFNTSGGDGSPIEYMAPGITGWTTNPNQFVDEGSRTALDVQPFTLTARQNGVTVTYIWDLRAYCNGTPPPPPVNPPTGGSLALLAPTYNCTTGAFTFNTSGGNGSTIEYMAPGITGWTTNPNQFVDQGSRTANDVQPFTLSARQSGVTVTYVWNLKAACGRLARVAAIEPGAGLRVRVLGNPVINQTAEVEITGAQQQTLYLNLVDLQGRVLHQQRIDQAESTHRVSVPMGERQGIFLFNISTPTQRQQVKLMKP